MKTVLLIMLLLFALAVGLGIRGAANWRLLRETRIEAANRGYAEFVTDGHDIEFVWKETK